MKKIILIAGSIIFALILFNFESNLKKRIGFLNYDFYQKFFEEDFSSDQVVIVDIDEKSIDEIGQFPWRRDVYSQILTNLTKSEVNVIAFDVFFSELDNQNPDKILNDLDISYNGNKIINTDELFLKSIENSKVIMPILGAKKDTSKNSFTGKSNIITKGENPLNYLYNFQGYITSLSEFNDAAKGLGSISILDSTDGVLRFVPLFLNINNQLIPSLSLESVRLLNNENSYLIRSDTSGIQEIKTRTYNFETNENALNYVKYKRINEGAYISAVDILRDNFDKNFLKNKIILIGSSAAGIFDLIKAPNGRIIPGVQVHANIIENILSGDFIKINLITKLTENLLLLLSLIIIVMITNYLKPIYSILNYVLLVCILFTISIVGYQSNFFVEIYNVIIFASVFFIYLLYRRFVEENKSSIDNEKKQLVMKKEREIAGEVQKKLFPTNKGLEEFIYASNVPAKDVSGDYYDYIKVSDDEIYFTLADVSGKGIKAGMLMANASSVFKSLSKLRFPIKDLALNINNQVKESSYKGMFITAVIGKLNIKTSELEFINFGHESIMIVDENSSFSYIEASRPPLGLMAIKSADKIETSKIDLLNKKLFIYTDGVTEGYISGDEELTVQGIEKIVREDDKSDINQIVDRVTKALNNRENLRDDITMMGLTVKS